MCLEGKKSDCVVCRARARVTEDEVLREVELMRSLTHPNVLDVLGVVAETNTGGRVVLSIVMELATGGDLHRVLKEEKHCLVRRMGWARQAALGLAWIHGAGLVHRDFKPKNLLLMRENEDSIVKVCDLGLATWLEQLEPGIALTTLNYAPPELRLDRKYGAPGDWWSFGMSLVQFVTGQMPFAGEENSMDELLRQGIIPRPRVPPISPEFPPSVATLIDDCLKEAPEQRPRGEAIVRAFDFILAESTFADWAIGGRYSLACCKHFAHRRMVPFDDVVAGLALSMVQKEFLLLGIRRIVPPCDVQKRFAVDLAADVGPLLALQHGVEEIPEGFVGLIPERLIAPMLQGQPNAFLVMIDLRNPNAFLIRAHDDASVEEIVHPPYSSEFKLKGELFVSLKDAIW